MFLLQISDPLIEGLIKNSYYISPYNALGYGMTVLLLLITSIKLYLDLKKEREYIMTLNEKVLTLTSKYIENSVRFELAVAKTAENKEALQHLINSQNELMNQIRELKLIIESKY